MITLVRKIGNLYSVIIGDNNIYKLEILDEFMPTLISLKPIDSQHAIKTGEYYLDKENSILDRLHFDFVNINDNQVKMSYYPSTTSLAKLDAFYPFISGVEVHEVGTQINLNLIMLKGSCLRGQNITKPTLAIFRYTIDNRFSPKRLLYEDGKSVKVLVDNVYYTDKSRTFYDHKNKEEVTISFPDFKIGLVIGYEKIEKKMQEKNPAAPVEESKAILSAVYS